MNEKCPMERPMNTNTPAKVSADSMVDDALQGVQAAMQELDALISVADGEVERAQKAAALLREQRRRLIESLRDFTGDAA